MRSSFQMSTHYGSMGERFNPAVLKTVVGHTTASSNLAATAKPVTNTGDNLIIGCKMMNCLRLTETGPKGCV